MPIKVECGTNAGYRKHLRLKEEVCKDCLEAHALTARAARAARKRPKYPTCECGKRIYAGYDKCSVCRRSAQKVRISWEKRKGVFYAVDVFDPELDGPRRNLEIKS